MIHGLKRIFSSSVMHSALAQFGKVSLKAFALYSGIGIGLVALVVGIFLYFKKRLLLSDILAGIVLAIYLSIILQLTLVCRESGSRIGIDISLFHGLIGEDNTYHWIMWAYMILNILLFVPFGFVISLFSIVNEKEVKLQLVTVLLISCMQSILIECIQLITQRGIFEIQDLVCNTLGGVLGWCVFALIYLVGKYIRRVRRSSGGE